MPTPPLIPEPKASEMQVPVSSPPEVPEPKESAQHFPVSVPVELLKEEKVESAGSEVPQEHKESGKDSPAPPLGQEEDEEVVGAQKEEETPACKQEDKKEVVPEVHASVPHVKKEALLQD